jgi:hypothetical protein
VTKAAWGSNDGPVLVTVAFDHLSIERSSRPQPCAAYAGREVKGCSLGREKLGV